jgi:ribulose-phosphate 3-epimerase
MAKIIPGILTNNEDDYRGRLRKAEEVSDLIQIDVVDGKFSKNTTVGVNIIKKYPSSSQLEIQLMVVDPKKYIDELIGLDYVSRIIFPFEIKSAIKELIYLIKKHHRQAGLSLNPETPIEEASDCFEDIDLLLLMTGKPGYSGQKLGSSTYSRIKEAKNFSPDTPLEIDIGVDSENAAKLAAAGADFLVVSSAIYKASDFYVAYEKLAKLAGNRHN